ncbi:hypothetical protein PF008_g5091 [Phytophthora fragariae]|uniref:MULE transposase domain-containing protein n=3 Tax=Phytophthora TaxID=4783 RepID=A0A6G0S9P5_9STRA|nr:hypothetical protein PF008_g5091 [Phytophthora fragariae]
MPTGIDWNDVALGTSALYAERVLGALKTYEVAKCNQLAYMPMAREDFIVHGDRSGVDIPGGEHVTAASSPGRKRLTPSQKAYIQELTLHLLEPMSIRHAMSRRFETVLQDLPSLSTVQNFVQHYSRTHLTRNDRVDDLRKWTHEGALTGQEDLAQPFTYAWALDADGKPVVGNDSDERPFLVGMTTKTLMLRLMSPPPLESFGRHVDATYKLNHRGYPVFVVGISDRPRALHLVSMFIVSGETQDIIQPLLYSVLYGHDQVVQYAMADADYTQYNAVNAVFGNNPRFISLMCFFHVMQKV